jgi:hypothetical protein
MPLGSDESTAPTLANLIGAEGVPHGLGGLVV